jgi:hypothetical protein
VQCGLARGPIGRGRRGMNVLEHCGVHPAEMGGQHDGDKQDAGAYQDSANHRFRGLGPEETEEKQSDRSRQHLHRHKRSSLLLRDARRCLITTSVSSARLTRLALRKFAKLCEGSFPWSHNPV